MSIAPLPPLPAPADAIANVVAGVSVVLFPAFTSTLFEGVLSPFELLSVILVVLPETNEQS